MTYPLPFDRVVVAHEHGEHVLSLEEFLAQPLDRRVQHLLGGKLLFRQGAALVDRRIALKALRERMAVSR